MKVADGTEQADFHALLSPPKKKGERGGKLYLNSIESSFLR
jgi:hypothetical protein